MRPLFSENCEYLPLWKAGATPEERLLELAAVAAKHPEWFDKLLVIYLEDPPGGRTTTRYAGTGTTTLELLGMLRICEWEVHNTAVK